MRIFLFPPVLCHHHYTFFFPTLSYTVYQGATPVSRNTFYVLEREREREREREKERQRYHTQRETNTERERELKQTHLPFWSKRKRRKKEKLLPPTLFCKTVLLLPSFSSSSESAVLIPSTLFGETHCGNLPFFFIFISLQKNKKSNRTQTETKNLTSNSFSSLSLFSWKPVSRLQKGLDLGQAGHARQGPGAGHAERRRGRREAQALLDLLLLLRGVFSSSPVFSTSSICSFFPEPGHAVGRREAVPGARRVDHGGHARRGLRDDAREEGGRGGGLAFAFAASPITTTVSSSSAVASLDHHAPLSPSLHEHGAERGRRPRQEQPRRGLDLGVALRPRT